MGKKILFFYWLVIAVFLLSIGLGQGRAIDIWGDKLTLDGFLAYELVLHTGTKNPAYTENHKFSLARAFFQTEWEYKPTDIFKIYSKVKLMHDQTDNMNGDSFDAFPRSAPSELRIAGNDEYQFEVSEIYGDINIGELFLRLGRQQIVWGEMIGARIMDIINPLDLSWHSRFEPEEFENIHVAQWSIRGIYAIEQNIVPWLWNLSLEGFINPGDISPDTWSDYGAPFAKGPYPDFFKIDYKDRRGDTEYGFRVGGSIGQFYATFNYFHLYTDSEYLQRTAVITPGPGTPVSSLTWLIDARYPLTDIYGLTVNYAFNQPISTVISFEGTYIPNQPYGDAYSDGPGIRDNGTFNWSIAATRRTFVFPTPISAMNIILQFTQNVVEGDTDDILGPKSSRMNTTKNQIMLKLTQPFFKADLITADFQVIYDLEDALLLKPVLIYKTGDHWIFDIQGAFLGGSEKRMGRFGSINYYDEVMFRLTYQF